MNDEQRKRISKRLSYVLRHHPDDIGVKLDEAGWVDVDVLLAALHRHGRSVSREQLGEVAATNDKQRFAFSEDGRRIRANQGHSVSVDLGYESASPPEFLYHGTVDRFLDSIRRDGLNKRKRHHVHLSPAKQTAIAVGTRRGKPVVLTIHALQMADAGHEFFVTPNKVWLVDSVPPQFIDLPSEVSVP